MSFRLELSHMPLARCLRHPANPVKVCSPTFLLHCNGVFPPHSFPCRRTASHPGIHMSFFLLDILLTDTLIQANLGAAVQMGSLGPGGSLSPSFSTRMFSSSACTLLRSKFHTIGTQQILARTLPILILVPYGSLGPGGSLSPSFST